MIDSREMVFVVDENNNPIKPQLRSFTHKNGLWHRTSGIWVINSLSQILCQKRSLLKDTKPGMWEAFFGGHLAPQQDYLLNALCETKEELGIDIAVENLIPYKVFKSDKLTHKEFQHVFGLMIDKRIEDFRFEKDEIDMLLWKDWDEIFNILTIEKNPDWVQKTWDKEVLNWLKTL